MHALTAWYSFDQKDGDVVRDAAELDAVLDRVAGIARDDWPALATLSPLESNGPVLYVGFHGEVGALMYVSVESGQEFSRNTDAPSDGEPLLYMYTTSDNEFPPDSEIPVDVVRRAAHYFAESQKKSPAVTWQEWEPVSDDSESEWPAI